MREVIARKLYFGQDQRQALVPTASEFCDAVQVFAVSDNYSVYLEDECICYNTVIVSGTDPVRICKLMRINRPLLRAKAKIARLRTASPENRAKMLSVGYDDVFLDGMPAVVCRARIEAILARLAQVREAATLQSVLDLEVSHYTQAPLNGREMRLMSLLLAAKGRPVPGFRLAATSRPPRPPMSEKSLQVLISVLRSKLRDHIVLEHQGAAGYALHPVSHLAEDGAANASPSLDPT